MLTIYCRYVNSKIKGEGRIRHWSRGGLRQTARGPPAPRRTRRRPTRAGRAATQSDLDQTGCGSRSDELHHRDTEAPGRNGYSKSTARFYRDDTPDHIHKNLDDLCVSVVKLQSLGPARLAANGRLMFGVRTISRLKRRTTFAVVMAWYRARAAAVAASDG